jgi:hypothetical protein
MVATTPTPPFGLPALASNPSSWAKLINRDPDVIGGGWIAGNTDPVPVPDPGWTPIYSPWGNGWDPF